MSRRLPVPLVVTAVVELMDDETEEDAVAHVRLAVGLVVASMDACAAECVERARLGVPCELHSVRLIVGHIGIKPAPASN